MNDADDWKAEYERWLADGIARGDALSFDQSNEPLWKKLRRESRFKDAPIDIPKKWIEAAQELAENWHAEPKMAAGISALFQDNRLKPRFWSEVLGMVEENVVNRPGVTERGREWHSRSTLADILKTMLLQSAEVHPTGGLPDETPKQYDSRRKKITKAMQDLASLLENDKGGKHIGLLDLLGASAKSAKDANVREHAQVARNIARKAAWQTGSPKLHALLRGFAEHIEAEGKMHYFDGPPRTDVQQPGRANRRALFLAQELERLFVSLSGQPHRSLIDLAVTVIADQKPRELARATRRRRK